MTFRLNITQDCINRGTPNDGTECPIAHALLEAGFSNPHVFDNHYFFIEFEKDGKEYKVFEPLLENWADNFDEGNKVFPLSIEIEVD